jgi:hypothetical protein
MFAVANTSTYLDFQEKGFISTAIVDYLGSILIAMIVTKIPLVITTIGVFVLGIILHLLFCLKTGTEIWLIK